MTHSAAESPHHLTFPLVDSHAHLDAPDFDGDREAVIARAQQAGLRYLLLVADLARAESLRTIADLTDRHDGLYWAAGIDPHQATSAQEEHFRSLAKLAEHPKFVAVGEIGLDYYYDYPRDTQKHVLIRQLELARELKLPIIIHCRDAWADVRAMIKSHWTSTGLGGILHCFTGAREDAFDLMDSGFLVSFAGNLTFKKAESLRAAAREIPLDRLLTETDCPYLAPVPYRGKRNEPTYVREVTRQLADVHHLGEEEMGWHAVANFERFFHLRR
ncbi:MAG TPA: TatD family hydrolase [Terriglobia bacterium]|nr:TatD family hydrolase [Terriglobia bacterium]